MPCADAAFLHVDPDGSQPATCDAQGAELMSKFGVNVPPGKPVFSIDEVAPVCESLADAEGQVLTGS